VWLLALKNVKDIWRDKKIFVLSLFFPAFLLFVTHLFYAHSESLLSAIPLDVVNPEPVFPHVGKLLVMAMANVKLPQGDRSLFKMFEVSKKQALSDLRSGKVAGALFIPQGLSQSIKNDQSRRLLFAVNSNDKRSALLAPALSSLILHFDFLIEKSRGKIRNEPMTLTFLPMGGETINPELESFLNIFIFALVFLVSYVAGTWISEFERGSFTRFQLCRLPEGSMLGGTLLSTLFLGFLQVALLLFLGKMIGLSLDRLMVGIWPFAFFLILASVGLGFIFASFLEKEKQLNLYASLFLIPLYLLSGSLANDLQLDRISKFFPWHQGYLLLSSVLKTEPLPGLLMIQMIFSSLILAMFGLGVFSLRRLRHG